MLADVPPEETVSDMAWILCRLKQRALCFSESFALGDKPVACFMESSGGVYPLFFSTEARHPTALYLFPQLIKRLLSACRT